MSFLRSKSILGLLFVLIFITSSCVSVDTTRLSTAPNNLTPVNADQVKVYRNADSVPCDYSEVAIINTRGGSGTMKNDKLINKAKQEGGGLGANAIIIEKLGEKKMLLESEPTADVLAIYEKNCQ